MKTGQGFVWVLGLLLGLTAQARDLKPAEKLSDLDQLLSVVRSHYGPLEYKQTRIGLDLDRLREVYAPRAVAAKTNGEFYYLMLEVVAEFRDSHFGIRVPTARTASLPFSTELVDGKVLIDTIDRTKLKEATFPYQKGDEIVRLGGEDVQRVLDRLQKGINSGYSLTARRVSAFLLVNRPGARMAVPTGDVVVSIRRGTSDLVDDVKMTWTVTGDGYDEYRPETFMGPFASESADGVYNYHNLSWVNPVDRAENSYRCSGTSRIDRPTGAVEVMAEPFVAYYWPTPKGNVGYLRIPHYSFAPGADGKPMSNEIAYRKYEYAISVFEKNTVGLIIDQDHNCGGSVDHLEKMVGLFASAPYAPMQFQLLASKGEMLQFEKWLKQDTASNTLAYDGLKRVLDMIRQSWVDGLFLTPKTSISGETLLAPNSTRYTKPVVMTIDELSGSGGDAFPSLMQGYGRAKLIGTRTMGAGGHVEAVPPLNYSRLTISLTKSLFYRPDGVAVENNGAVPDYPYAITRDDFLYGYRSYRDFALSKLFEQL